MIDNERLPRRCLIDTDALVLALGDNPHDSRAGDCQEFFKAMTERGGHEILIAAPSLAEYLRRSRSADIPRTRSVTVVAFDEKAARLLAERLPAHVLTTTRTDTGATAGYIKYDAMIVACAIRHRAECLISLDRDHRNLASAASVPCFQPSHFQEQQQAFTLPPPAPLKPRD